VGYQLGTRLAAEARRKNETGPQGREAVVLWASDTVRDEGAMVGFALDMLGVRPVWNSRGIVKALERIEPEEGRVRRDVVGTTSGLFRDLYPNLLVWLDRAVLLALDASSERIRRDYPALAVALDGALERLGEHSRPGNEPLATNRVAAHWVEGARRALERGLDPRAAGVQASLRLFGDAPGGYGAGVNRLVERSGAWSSRTEVGEAYIHRMGHAYGAGLQGVSAHAGFKRALAGVENTYLGRASNLYGLIDNNDAFDYLGGLSLAVETLTGEPPSNHVIQHADPENPTMEPLERALLSELRGRFLNPGWIKPLMAHDYAGARTMGSEFLEYLWGWQVTNPDIVRGWVWDEVKRVYVDDGLELGLDEFLESGRNAHVKTNMLAIMLVAAQKGFWQPDEATLEELANEFARLVATHGLPGSGHTRPDHPVMEFVSAHLEADRRAALNKVLEAALGPAETSGPATTRIAEITPENSAPESQPPEEGGENSAVNSPALWYSAAALLLLILGGFINGARHVRN
jgi:cobaltochelatase CobN